MTSSPALEVIMSDKDYRQIATDTFQGYADEDFEGKLLWEAIKIDFEHWTKENWEAIDDSTWMTIKQHCIPRGVWIDHPGNNDTRSEILMKLVSATKYDIELKDWDMDRIKDVENTYGKVSRGIDLRIQALLGNIPDEPQTQPALSKPSPYAYHPHQRQLPPKQVPLPQPFSQQYQHRQFQNQNGPHDHQPAATPISNPVATYVTTVCLSFYLSVKFRVGNAWLRPVSVLSVHSCQP